MSFYIDYFQISVINSKTKYDHHMILYIKNLESLR